MAERCDFLVEVGTEELPPKALRGLSTAFLEGIESRLDRENLAFEEAVPFATPRRLAVKITGLATGQPDREIERRGPPVGVAVNDNGRPTRAGLKFAESCGVPFEALERLETKKGDYLGFRGVEKGRAAADLLPGIIEESLASLPVPRRMRWGDKDFEFVRPVHWILALIDSRVLPMELFDITAGRQTRGHRFHAPGPITVERVGDYPGILETDGRVIADFEARRRRVHEIAAASATAAGGRPVCDDALLDEVTALVEWPVAVEGEFDRRFLELPKEVLVSTLQAHQRYFPIDEASSGTLLPRFVAISNLDSADPGKVREGNQRVVRPRLSDAAFFWDTDRKRPLADRAEGLASVVYQRKLGTVADRVARIERLAGIIAEALGADREHATRAARLSKCDLLTDMVGEFPDLQGIMGRYYALHDNEPSAVADAIEEQYRPRFAGDDIPGTPSGQILALADKLELLTGIFAIGEKPSGTRDPYGLRRAAVGALRILVEGALDLPLPGLLVEAAEGQPAGDGRTVAEEVHAYMMDRLRSMYAEGLSGVRAPSEVFEAVLARHPVSVLDFHHRVQAVLEFAGLPEAASLAAANKRVANILRQAEISTVEAVDPDRLEEAEEKALFEALRALQAEVEPLLDKRDYRQALVLLASLRGTVDAFFDKVLVMAEDRDLRDNRLALLSQMRHLFLHTADLSRLGG